MECSIKGCTAEKRQKNNGYKNTTIRNHIYDYFNHSALRTIYGASTIKKNQNEVSRLVLDALCEKPGLLELRVNDKAGEAYFIQVKNTIENLVVGTYRFYYEEKRVPKAGWKRFR